MNRGFAIWFYGLVVAIASCARQSAEPAAEKAQAESSHRDEPEHAALPTRVHLDAKVMADAKIKVAPATVEVLAETLDLPGELAADPDRTARISALIAGRIEAVQFREGQIVQKGDVLAVIQAPELAHTKAAYTATAAKAVAARANAARLRDLAGERLAGKQEVAAATAESHALDAQANAARGELRALGANDAGVATQLTVRAPIGGVILARQVVVGQHVEPQDFLGTIADLQQVWFVGRVFERNVEHVRSGAEADVQLNAYVKQHFMGKVESVSQQIDPIAHTVIARIRLQNREQLLRLGLFGIAQVGTGDPSKQKPVLVVDHNAITEIGGKPVVFVGHPDGDFEVHEVILGKSALGKVEIVSGLRVGENVVIDGVFTLRSILLKSTFAEEE